MLKFTVNNCYTYVKDFTPEEIELVKSYCSHSVKKFVSLYKNNYGGILPAFKYKQLSPADKKNWKLETAFDISSISYFYDKYNSFPTGWLLDIADILSENNIEYQISDNRKLNAPILIIPNQLPPLRYYQEECVKLTVEIERGIIQHPTGSGKTVTSCAILANLGLPSLIIVPNLILLNQTYNYMQSCFDSSLIGKIGEGDWNPKLFTVATAQTLWSRIRQQETKDFLNSVQLLIGDECHKINENEEHLPNTWYRVAMQCHNAFYRFGMSATPGKPGSLQRKLLEGITGCVIHKVELQELIDNGYLTDAKIIIKKLKMPRVEKNWRKSYEENILNNTQRNHTIALFAEKFSKENKSVLIIVDEVEEHAKKLNEMLPASAILIGESKKKIRQEVLDEFKAGKLHILISTLLSEGFDFRGLDVVILAAGKKSNKLVAQRVGRALRTEAGKKEAIIVDFYDDDGGFLVKHSKQRIEVYKELGFKIEVI